MELEFMNEANGARIRSNYQWLWALLFGPFFFVYHGVWTHAFIGIALGFMTGGLSWIFVYPFFAGRIIRNHYLNLGWRESLGGDVWAKKPV